MLTGRRRPAARLFWRWRFVAGLRGQDTWGQGSVRFWTCGQKKSMIIMNSNLTMLQLIWPGLTLPMTGLYQAWDNRTERLDKGRMYTCTWWCTCSILNWGGNKVVNVIQCSRYIIWYLTFAVWGEVTGLPKAPCCCSLSVFWATLEQWELFDIEEVGASCTFKQGSLSFFPQVIGTSLASSWDLQKAK